MMSIIFAVLAGISVTLQNSLNGLMTPHVGAMATSFIGFIVQVIALCAYQLIRERKMVPLRKVPGVYYSSGLLAALVVGCIGLCVSKMGSAVTTCCSVAGQIIMSAFVDHFGLFGTNPNRFSAKRIPGFVVILAGVLSMNLIGGTGEGEAKLTYLALAVGLGVCAVVIRTLNFKASNIIGSTIGGGIVNSIGGAVSALVLLLIVSGFKPDFSGLPSVPVACYFAGILGVACMLFNISAYKDSNVFYATIFMLIGQVGTGIIMDILIFHSLSAGKCIGIAIVVAGVLLDKILTRKK